jgi:hypothetical protein
VTPEPELETMTDDEIEEYIKDSIATLRILADKKSPAYDRVMDHFTTDMAYLVNVGRIGEDDYNELTAPDNLRF